ncbi:MAG: hypothetical protein AUK47_01710 [Deltaproteobacteria bacterium CG2_30_63_29]|nr:MAG: hypothetical protein AUK47_01710 [Deltaproteobacteria bacterium CG2_30_63_29]PJB45680.1 MAG: hypothetical protein CO108_06865 [Deltaproteobacteria bacterium CG_4_9_14_3_um_filter_63_12]
MGKWVAQRREGPEPKAGEERANKKPTPPSYDKVMSKALALLGKRAHASEDLRERLGKFCEDAALVGQVLARLHELAYLDDALFAADYAHSRLRLKPTGRRQLQQDLRRRKVPPELIEQTLDTLYAGHDEQQDVVRAVEKWTRQRGLPSDPKERHQLVAHLARRGFRFERIRTALDALR